MATTASAQQFLAIETIREGVVILKEGGYRVILMCSSINFALKSVDEQDAIIFQYQNFINSLDFPLQFVIHSRKLNITPYLNQLIERRREEDNELLKVQITEYIEFIKTFVEMTNVMSKTFYISVPFTPPVIKQGGVAAGLTSFLKLGKKASGESADQFEEYKNQLWQRVDTVVDGLQKFGIRAVPLNTEELIELFYGLYNPTEFEKALVTPTEGENK